MPQITVKDRTGGTGARMVDQSKNVIFSDNTLKIIAHIVSMHPSSEVTFNGSEAVIDIPE